MVVIQNRFVAAEAFGAHDLLAVERAVGLAKLCMALVRDFTQPMVEGHRRPPFFWSEGYWLEGYWLEGWKVGRLESLAATRLAAWQRNLRTFQPSNLPTF